jgi:Tol biopolymer transport system component
MPGVTRRALGLGLGILAVLLVASVAPAAAPEGPRLAFLEFVNRPNALRVATGDASLGARTAVAGGSPRVRPFPYGLSGPAWSPDGALIAFTGMRGPPSGLFKPRRRQIYLVAADGGGLATIPGTREGFGPVFFPGGRRIAFAKSKWGLPSTTRKSISVWSVDLDGSGLTQLTGWAPGIENLPSSFSPDGSILAFTHRDAIRERVDARALRLSDGRSFVLARNAKWPRYSPDGSRIAFIGVEAVDGGTCCELGDGFTVDLYTMSANGSSRRRLTDTRLKAEQPPSWDPSGERLAYMTAGSPAESLGSYVDSVMQVNADGTCPSRISAPVLNPNSHWVAFRFPVWRPGPGREAGRIVC